MPGSFDRDPTTARMGKEILPFESGTLTDFFQRKAELELHDTPERRMQGLKQMKNLARSEKVTRGIVFSDDFLLQYLKARKYDVTKAFSQLKNFVNLRRKNPLLFSHFRVETALRGLDYQFLTLLPFRCQDGCTILLVELDNWDPRKYPVEEVKRIIVILLLQSLREPMSQVNGFKAIINVKSNPFRHLMHVTFNNLYLLIHGTQDCVPGRYKSIHIVNNSITFKAAWLLIKCFLTDKLKSRIRYHDTPETLLEYFPKSVLPVHYGGELENYDMSHWLKKMMQPQELEMMIGGKYPDELPLIHSAVN